MQASGLLSSSLPIAFPHPFIPVHVAGRSSHHPNLTAFASIGFTAEPRARIERAGNGLLKDAAALLVYQEVLRIPAAQAFLKVVLALRRGEDGWKLLEAYGEFYKLMAMGNFSCWEDLVLEGILAGEGNPFAEAAANVGNPKSHWSGGVPPSLQAAAAADLDSLQRLSITESTLVGWVNDLVPDVRPEWRVAAESSLNSRTIRKASMPTADECNVNFGFDVLSSDDIYTESDIIIENYEEKGMLKDFEDDGTIASEREIWRKKIGGLWRWSDAVPLLEKYYAEFSIGRVASAEALQCKGGKLLQDPKFFTFQGDWNLSINQEHREKLFKAFEKHTSQSASHHILVCGPSGSGKSWLVKSALYSLSSKGKLRVVTVPKNEIKNLQGVLEELARNWQLRFVLVVDGLSVIEDLMYMEWPENVLLCVTRLVPSFQKGVEPDAGKPPSPCEFNDIFGTIVNLPNLDLDRFLLCVEEIWKYNGKTCGGAGTNDIHESILNQAISWANERKVLSVRTATQFVKSIL